MNILEAVQAEIRLNDAARALGLAAAAVARLADTLPEREEFWLNLSVRHRAHQLEAEACMKLAQEIRDRR